MNNMTFDQLGLAKPILRAVAAEGYQTPTPIQRQAIPPIMAGRDVVGCGQTGTGKTAAFALPILHRLQSPARGGRASPSADPSSVSVASGARASGGRVSGGLGSGGPRALVLAPTRELAAQIDESFRTYGRGLELKSLMVCGGVSQGPQERGLRCGVDILIATPGRLLDLLAQRIADLSAVEVLVLDEADRMLDMGFLPDIRRIIASLSRPGRQTLLFSATMPAEIRSLAGTILRDAVAVEASPVASPVESIEQSVCYIDRPRKPEMLEHILRTGGRAADPGPGPGSSTPGREHTHGGKRAPGRERAPGGQRARGHSGGPPARALVFTRTKHGADKVVRTLQRCGIRAEAIHGNKSQNARTRALASFRSSKPPVLVATDIASRGIDVDGITHVINYDIPALPETYVHRIGRTARAGATGQAISLCSQEERDDLRAIERLIRMRIPVHPNLTGECAARASASSNAGPGCAPGSAAGTGGSQASVRNGASGTRGRNDAAPAALRGGRPGQRSSPQHRPHHEPQPTQHQHHSRDDSTRPPHQRSGSDTPHTSAGSSRRQGPSAAATRSRGWRPSGRSRRRR
jgi:ATP-dependent RNA helicase RhlE